MIDDNVTIVRFQEVLLGRDRLPLVTPREQLDVVLAAGGGLSFHLHPDYVYIIEDALEIEEPEESQKKRSIKNSRV